MAYYGMRNIQQRHSRSEIIVTESPDDLPMILRPDVRAVIWRRGPQPDVDAAVPLFTARGYQAIFNASGGGIQTVLSRGFDEKQAMIETYAQRHFPELAPVWRDRQRVQKTLERKLYAPFFLNRLQVQPAQRHTPDHIPHQDRGTTKKRNWKDLRIIATMAHVQDGTIIIPKDDAGRQTPESRYGRAFYHHPHTLKNVFQAGTHDVCLTKTGRFEGAVHKAPYVRGGLRLLTFLISTAPYPEIRKQFDLNP